LQDKGKFSPKEGYFQAATLKKMSRQISLKAMNGWGKRKQDTAIALAMERKENRGNRSRPCSYMEMGTHCCVMIQAHARQKQRQWVKKV
jgi:hypothetical protein